MQKWKWSVEDVVLIGAACGAAHLLTLTFQFWEIELFRPNLAVACGSLAVSTIIWFLVPKQGKMLAFVLILLGVSLSVVANLLLPRFLGSPEFKANFISAITTWALLYNAAAKYAHRARDS